MRALNTAATGMQAQQLNVEVIANNIANMNTTGFKRQRAEFQDLLYQNVERMGVTSSDQGTIVPTGVQVGGGVKAGSVYRITEQGSMTATGNRYDVAIDGRGYLQVLKPSGEATGTENSPESVHAFGQLEPGPDRDPREEDRPRDAPRRRSFVEDVAGHHRDQRQGQRQIRELRHHITVDLEVVLDRASLCHRFGGSGMKALVLSMYSR